MASIRTNTNTTTTGIAAVGGVVAAAALGYAGYKLVKRRSAAAAAPLSGGCPFALNKKLSKEQMAALSTVPAGSISVTCTAPVNIAVIKYWGKRDDKLILPVNSSLSGTIDQDAMCSTTTIIASKSFDKEQMFLNDVEETITGNPRLVAVINSLRALAPAYYKDGQVLIARDDWKDYKLRIISNNNFPTAAGLASSASGLSALAFCLARLYGVSDSYPGELSTIARMGSGSACRSLDGGFVKWNMGEEKSGRDSIAVQVADEKHWPEIRVLILVVREGRKTTSSTSGMEDTVKTSSLLQRRITHDVPQRMIDMEKYIGAKDFHNFAELTMVDSNSFHAVCLDTKPPIMYLKPTSMRIIYMVETINRLVGRNVAGYTFDAGPNAVIYTLEPHMDKLLELFLQYFLPNTKTPAQYLNDPTRSAKIWNNKEALNKVGTGVGEAKAQPFERKPRDFGSLTIDELKAAIGGGNTDEDRVASIIVTKLGAGAMEKTRNVTL